MFIQGIPVLGYIFWTISDNWEWADGYGPKFGLVEVDRDNRLSRHPRPSYYLFSKVSFPHLFNPIGIYFLQLVIKSQDSMLMIMIILMISH